jgi:hypothetical protein
MEALLLLFIQPVDPTLVDHVDVIEINHLYRHGDHGSARLVFDQVVFWEWVAISSSYRVVAWRIMPDAIVRGQQEWLGGHATPHRSGRRWVSFWWDARHDVFRRVYATHAFHSETFYDVEIVERKITPEHLRRGLRKS